MCLFPHAGGCVHLRPVPGRGGVGPAGHQADGVHPQGALHPPPRGPHVCHQLHRPQGPPPLPVPRLQEARPHRPHLHHLRHTQDHPVPGPLDASGSGLALRYQVNLA